MTKVQYEINICVLQLNTMVYMSKELGQVIDTLQVERDQTILVTSKIGFDRSDTVKTASSDGSVHRVYGSLMSTYRLCE